MAQRKSSVVSISFLSSVAAALTGCSSQPATPIHLNATGQCISEDTGQVIDQRICYGSGGGYYGGRHYVYIPLRSAPYYANPGSPGYVRPWGGGSGGFVGSGSSSSSTVRGFFGSSASGAGE